MAKTASVQAGAMFSIPTISLSRRRESGGERTAGRGRTEAARRPAPRRGLHRVHPPDRPEGSRRVCARLCGAHTPPGAKGRRGGRGTDGLSASEPSLILEKRGA
eukprot:6213555-Pleurochrysis_carterae.AAC.2